MGVSYRTLDAPGLQALQGAGVYYGAARAEARGVAGQDVFIVGGGNSAGQAAVHLAQYARQVTILIRGESLASSMSDYLLREINRTPNIAIRARSVVAEAHGPQRLTALTIRMDGEAVVEPAGAVFIMIGAHPDTAWLPPAIARDPYGYILTGEDTDTAHGAVLPYETSVPGIFAVGDLRRGAVKRVASAVGEGAVSMVSIHRRLAESSGATAPA